MGRLVYVCVCIFVCVLFISQVTVRIGHPPGMTTSKDVVESDNTFPVTTSDVASIVLAIDAARTSISSGRRGRSRRCRDLITSGTSSSALRSCSPASRGPPSSSTEGELFRNASPGRAARCLAARQIAALIYCVLLSLLHEQRNIHHLRDSCPLYFTM